MIRDAVDDLVRVAVRPRSGRPDVEIGVADEGEQAPRRVALDRVRAGRRDGPRADVVKRRSRGDRHETGELPEQARVGCRQPERQCRASLDDDAAGEVAGTVVDAAGGAGELGEVRRQRAVQLELAGERASEVGSADRASVGVVDALAEMERVARASRGRKRERRGEVGHELRACGTAGVAQTGQAVVGGGKHRSRKARDPGIDRVEALPEHHEPAAPVAPAGGLRRDPNAVVAYGDALGAAAERCRAHNGATPRVDPHDAGAELGAHPDRAVGVSDGRGPAGHGDHPTRRQGWSHRDWKRCRRARSRPRGSHRRTRSRSGPRRRRPSR